MSKECSCAPWCSSRINHVGFPLHIEFGVSPPEALDALIDEVFRLDSATCPLLWRDGPLRPMVEAAFASVVMYFEERQAAGEMTFVL